MPAIDDAGFVIVDMQEIIDEVAEQAAMSALRAAEAARNRRLFVQGILSGKPACDISMGIHRGTL